MVQQGIQSLMTGGQQAPMPGQAPQMPMQGMMPKPSAATPGAMVGPLTQMHLDQLTQMMLNPRPEGPPLYAVLSAITEKQKQAQAQASMQRQMAMAQGQQAAQQPPIAQQVLAQAQQQAPVRAAQGGIMQGYAGGGAVAFSPGGSTTFEPFRQKIAEYQDAIKQLRAAIQSGDSASAARYAQMVQTLRQQLEPKLMEVAKYKSSAAEAPSYAARVLEQGIPQELASTAASPQVGANQPFPFGPPESPMMEVPEIQIAAPRPPGATRPGTGIAQGQNRPQAAPAAAQTAVAPADLSPEMQKMYADREAEMRRRLTRPESLVSAEQGLAALAKSNIEAQQAEAKAYGEEIRAARDAALARSQRDILSDPMALLTLAGSIDTRRGRGIGSLAQGAAGLMGQREAAAQAARKEFAQAQRDERSMQANIRQTQMLEAQRQVALEQGKLNEVNAINYKLAELGMEREKFRLTRGDKAFDQALEGRKVAATERQARAAEKPTGTVALLRELGLAPTLENVGKLVEVQQGPKSEASERAAMLKAIVGEAIKNPFTLKQYPPEIQTLVRNEIAKLGVVDAIPQGAPVRK